jgi:DNA-binding transcriptional ArsR family regulator
MARLAKSSNFDRVAACLEALGNPTRLQVLRVLVRADDAGLAVGQLRRQLTGVAPSTLSHHLLRLSTVGLIKQERKGATLICRAECRTMANIIGFLRDECSAEVDPTR